MDERGPREGLVSLAHPWMCSLPFREMGLVQPEHRQGVPEPAQPRQPHHWPLFCVFVWTGCVCARACV